MSQTANRRGRSPRQTRAALRAFHLVLGTVMGVAVYSPAVSDEAQRALFAFGVFPALTVTGLLLWQQARVRRLLRRVTTRIPAGASTSATDQLA